MAVYTTTTPQQTRQLGRRLATALTGGEIVAFTGGLGAGKTLFCAGMAEALGSTDPVSSPTFAIANFYRGRIPFAHFDAYRVTGPEDLETAGFYDYLEQGAVVAVEWFENIAPFVQEPVILVEFKVISETMREIAIKGAAGL
ncbi:MAG: tRNA (adenosine(37)-N6)-threonylcarbamoyltransferase complex ATPase subunit type 1 TsaE [Oscillospiraceae bacterium]